MPCGSTVFRWFIVSLSLTTVTFSGCKDACYRAVYSHIYSVRWELLMYYFATDFDASSWSENVTAVWPLTNYTFYWQTGVSKLHCSAVIALSCVPLFSCMSATQYIYSGQWELQWLTTCKNPFSQILYRSLWVVLLCLELWSKSLMTFSGLWMFAGQPAVTMHTAQCFTLVE